LKEELLMQKVKREISGLLKSAKEKNIKTLIRVNETLKKMINEKQIITFSQVAKQAQVSRAWLYKNDEIKNQIEAIREEQSKKVPVDLIAKERARNNFRNLHIYMTPISAGNIV